MEDKPVLSRGRVLDFLTNPRTRAVIAILTKPLFMPGNRIRTHYISLPQAGTRPHRLVLIADLHAHHKHTSLKKLQRVVAKINMIEDVDFVALPGDFVSKLDPDAIKIATKALRKCRYPMYGTLGNHDHDMGAEKITRELEEIGVIMLTDNLCAFDDEINLAGVDSISHMGILRKHFSSLEELKNLDQQKIEKMLTQQAKNALEASDKITIVLGHEPALASMHEHFLHLAGHTHWGQIGIGPIARKMYPFGSWPYPKGLYQVQDRYIYTTSGIGHHLPGRIFAPPEIAVIDF